MNESFDKRILTAYQGGEFLIPASIWSHKPKQDCCKSANIKQIEMNMTYTLERKVYLINLSEYK